MDQIIEAPPPPYEENMSKIDIIYKKYNYIWVVLAIINVMFAIPDIIFNMNIIAGEINPSLLIISTMFKMSYPLLLYVIYDYAITHELSPSDRWKFNIYITFAIFAIIIILQVIICIIQTQLAAFYIIFGLYCIFSLFFVGVIVTLLNN